jgi:hypothetical protein
MSQVHPCTQLSRTSIYLTHVHRRGATRGTTSLPHRSGFVRHTRREHRWRVGYSSEECTETGASDAIPSYQMKTLGKFSCFCVRDNKIMERIIYIYMSSSCIYRTYELTKFIKKSKIIHILFILL